MKKSTSELLAEIKQVQAQYLDEVGRGGHKVWPKSIKERVLSLAAHLGSAKEAAKLCEISPHTIYQWRLRARRSQFKSLSVVDRSDKSPTVTVTNDRRSRRQSNESLTVTVTSPGGYIVEGLSSVHAFEFLLSLEVR
jgi:transposase-like protein